MPVSDNPTSELLTPDELADMLKISKAGVYRLITKRKIPFYKVMGSLRFEKRDIISYLQQNRVELIGLEQYGSKKN
ncbi:MAG: helix-turn-helix domain-containing protein [Candidatus Dadabacteria bacterium]|nr:helix-turn-helix domain-containing protein [Candidatus Dadabacteria bacterium]